MDLPELLSDGTITLRRYRMSDAAALKASTAASHEHLRGYMPWAAEMPTDGSVMSFLEPAVEGFATSGNAYYAIILADDTYIGGCGIHDRVGPGALEIGYWVDVGHVRRGIATAAARLLTDACFSSGAQRVVIRCDVSNVASAGVPRALGFRLSEVRAKEALAPKETGQEMVWTMRRSLQPNRDHWNATSERYQSAHRQALESKAWGSWRVPESEVNVLGDLAGHRVLELGCGAGQWSAALADDGIAVIGLDLSDQQLFAAAGHMRNNYPLVQGAAEEVPFGDETFDVVFCDHGGLSWGDPHQVVPEVARVLRPNGRLIFAATSPVMAMAYHEETDRVTTTLHGSYFDLYRSIGGDGATNYTLTYGEWIRLLVKNGLVVEDLIEPRPSADAPTTYYVLERADWAHRWPAEVLWVARRAGN